MRVEKCPVCFGSGFGRAASRAVKLGSLQCHFCNGVGSVMLIYRPLSSQEMKEIEELYQGRGTVSVKVT